MIKKDYIRPKTFKKFNKIVRKHRGIEQDMEAMKKVFKYSCPKMIDFVCTKKAFGIGTASTIAELGEDAQLRFLDWYGVRVLVKTDENGKRYYGLHPVADVKAWILEQRKEIM